MKESPDNKATYLYGDLLDDVFRDKMVDAFKDAKLRLEQRLNTQVAVYGTSSLTDDLHASIAWYTDRILEFKKAEAWELKKTSD